MRKIGSSRGAVTAYPRQLESLIRLAEAHAKMRYDPQLLRYCTVCELFLCVWLDFQLQWK